jgi:hypothetical protein
VNRRLENSIERLETRALTLGQSIDVAAIDVDADDVVRGHLVTARLHLDDAKRSLQLAYHAAGRRRIEQTYPDRAGV